MKQYSIVRGFSIPVYKVLVLRSGMSWGEARAMFCRLHRRQDEDTLLFIIDLMNNHSVYLSTEIPNYAC